MMEKEMTDEMKVKAVYKDAEWDAEYGGIYVRRDVISKRISGNDWWKVESNAWADAASRLPA